MEYLVTMTTHVPAGTSDSAVADIRTREAARAQELAGQHHLLRLWRPPLQPGEWRTLGLFAAVNGGDLERTLASMPLRVWRTDEVTPLSPHPNDPALHGTSPSAVSGAGGSEFLTTFAIEVPPDTPDETVEDTKARESARARELARAGHLLRLWTLTCDGDVLGLWRAADSAAMQEIVASLPMSSWMRVQVTSLTPRPSDPVFAEP